MHIAIDCNIVVKEVYRTLFCYDSTNTLVVNITRIIATSIEVEHRVLAHHTYTVHTGIYRNTVVDGEGLTVMANTTSLTVEIVGTTIKRHLGLCVVSITIVNDTCYFTITLDGQITEVLKDVGFGNSCSNIRSQCLTIEVKDYCLTTCDFHWSGNFYARVKCNLTAICESSTQFSFISYSYLWKSWKWDAP